MKRSFSRRMLGVLLALVMVIGMIPATTLTVHAGHRCPDCDDWIDGSPYCEDCYECAECCKLCLECGKCSDCSGWEICDQNCGDDDICVDCALDKGYHCPDCYDCYLETQVWCDECGLCSNCADNCYDCSIFLGKSGICVDCALEEGTHCPDCGGCYGPVQWCQVCGLCEDCSPICEGCTEEVGEYICEACAIDAGLHCPDCNGCYDESNWEYCSECGICANCVEYCDTYDLCLNCAVEQGYHCPSCDGCCENEPICASCGDACRECADDFCESCGLCSNCVQVCPSCGACSECAEICPNCGEYCSDCEDICDDCEFCLVCCADIAAFEGCDCGDWVCVESGDWQEHFDEEHIYTAEDGHSARPVKSWSWDENWHWQKCTYCDDSDHYSNRFAHTYDKRGMCTVCCYAKNTNIQILQQPEDVTHVKVQSPYEDHDGSNIAHFSVKAVGKTELTYTWYRRYYTGPGQWDYVPLTDPSYGECYEGPDLYVLASTDACYNEEYFMCIIVDEEGNQARTVEVMLKAQHNYQYFKYYQGDYPSDPYETAGRAPNYHNLQCVGEGCEKTVSVRPHEDENEDDECDICRREMPAILITQQPKTDRNVMVTSSDEDPLESNYAKYSVRAEGSSDLTYTWCRRVYTSPGVFHYEPLKNPRDGEVFDGPDARILAPEDACTNTYIYRCIITDEEGNTAETIDVVLEAKHNYQYYKYYQSQTGKYEEARRGEVYHIGVCVGNDCGKVSRMCGHVDEDKDFQCDTCYYINYIDELTLDYVQPLPGNTPDYNMTVDISACYIRGNGIDYSYRRWYESDNGVDGWRLMSPTDTFIGGKYYKMEVDVATISGREFSTYTYPTTTHTVWLWTGNRRGALIQTGNLSHKNYATLTLDSENPIYCQPEQINVITIEGLDEPITGQKPDYTVTLDGSGYRLDSGSTLYRKNGVMWKQNGESDAMHIDSKFIAGENYTCYITLVAEENYAFDSNIIATINGLEVTCELFNDNKTAVISYEYIQIPPARIKEVNLTDVTLPWEGAEVDWNVTLDSDLYYVDEFSWSDLTLNEAHYGEFQEGHRYMLGMMLVNEVVGGMFQCEFDENVIVTVNGLPATVIAVKYDGWTGSYVYFEVLCPPTGETVELVSQPKSVEVDKGKTATVIVGATGTNLTYTWYYKNKGSSNFSKATSYTGSSYSVEMNESSDGRQVYCVVTDGNGNQVTTNVATLAMVHNYTKQTTKATLTKNGSIVYTCTGCGDTGSTQIIARPTTFTLSTVNYTYNGQAKKPAVTVKDANGKTLVNGTDYTVTYPSGRTALGSYNVTVTMKGNYSGTKTLTFNINLAVPTVTATNAANGVKITWNKIAGAANYRVYKSVYTNGAWSSWTAIKTGVTGTTYTDTTVKSGHNVKYTVRAFNGNYSSTYKASNSIKFLAAPTVKAANAANGVKITWNAVGSAKTYTVYKSIYSNGAWGGWTKIKTGVTGTTYTDTTVKSGHNVKYTVRAVNGNFSSYFTSSNSIKFLATPKVTAANATNGVKLTWNAVGSAKTYTVYKSTYSGGKWSGWTKIKTGVTGTTYTDTTVKSGHNVKYTVRAVNGSFASYFTSSNSIKFLATPTVTAANATNGVKLTWNAVGSAKTYTVYKSTYSGGKWSGWTKIKTGVTGTTYTDTTVKSNANVRYTVRAVNGNFASYFKASNSIKFLAAPAVKVAKVTNGIKATWGKITGATGYIVYRRTYTSGKWSGWTAIKTTTALNFTDTTAKAGVTYQYTVRAYNGDFKSSFTNSSSIKR